MMFSTNNKLVVGAYKKEALKSTVTNGFAMIAQKVTVKGLPLFVEARLSDGTTVPAGSTVYFKEESLHTQPWAQKVFESEAIPGPFMIVDLSNVEFVDTKNG